MQRLRDVCQNVPHGHPRSRRYSTMSASYPQKLSLGFDLGGKELLREHIH
jgi:hypothetical protein